MEFGRAIGKAIYPGGHRPSGSHLSDTCSPYAATKTLRNMYYGQKNYSWASVEVAEWNLWKYRCHFKARLRVDVPRGKNGPQMNELHSSRINHITSTTYLQRRQYGSL
jgi:hypothetical protein